MTGKRFGVASELPKGWVDIIDTDNNQTLCNIRVEYANNMIKLLNELHEDLNHELTVSKVLREVVKELEKENKQLKAELKVYRKVASCSNCHYHDYDWYDEGDEFEVCDKGNDVTEGICEEWEEL